MLRTLDTRRYDRAHALLIEALARDPRFARAHQLLALKLANRVSIAALPAAEAMPAAHVHLQRALALDPDVAPGRSGVRV